jgi:hypothetical protein
VRQVAAPPPQRHGRAVAESDRSGYGSDRLITISLARGQRLWPGVPTVKKKLKDVLHRFKVEAFKMSHQGADDHSREILDHTGQALQNAYHFHFGKDTPPHRAEMFQMIKSVTLETLLPPVVEKLMRRITVLEHQNQAMIKVLDELMEVLSED